MSAERPLTRREFLGVGAMAAALLSAGRLPLLAQGIVSSSTPGPTSVQPITGFLGGFTPVTAARGLGEEYCLVYEIVHWNRTDIKTWQTLNDVAGTLGITRAVSSKGPRYEIAQEMTYSGVTNRLTARVTCDDDELNAIRQWQVAWSAEAGGEPVPDMRLHERGSVRNGAVHLGPRREVHVKQPVVSQWTVLDFVARRAGDGTDVAFALLEDLSLLKEGQHLAAAAPAEIPCASGTLPLRSFLQTGEGIHPRHYLVDDFGLPHLVTASMVSWALQRVE